MIEKLPSIFLISFFLFSFSDFTGSFFLFWSLFSSLLFYKIYFNLIFQNRAFILPVKNHNSYVFFRKTAINSYKSTFQTRKTDLVFHLIKERSFFIFFSLHFSPRYNFIFLLFYKIFRFYNFDFTFLISGFQFIILCFHFILIVRREVILCLYFICHDLRLTLAGVYPSALFKLP